MGIAAFAQGPEKLETSAAVSDQEVKPTPPQAVDQAQQTTTPAQTEPRPKKKKKFSIPDGIVVAPLPLSSPAIGTGITPILGYIFPLNKNDKVSPPSTIGGAGLITNNGSRGFVVGGQFFFKENTYEVTSGYAHGNVNYNIYADEIAPGVKLPVRTNGRSVLWGIPSAAYSGNFSLAHDSSQAIHLLRSAQMMT